MRASVVSMPLTPLWPWHTIRGTCITEKCPKCFGLGESFTVRSNGKLYEGDHGFLTICFEKREHFHVHCTACGGRWLMAPADHQEETCDR